MSYDKSQMQHFLAQVSMQEIRLSVNLEKSEARRRGVGNLSKRRHTFTNAWVAACHIPLDDFAFHKRSSPGNGKKCQHRDDKSTGNSHDGPQRERRVLSAQLSVAAIYTNFSNEAPDMCRRHVDYRGCVILATVGITGRTDRSSCSGPQAATC